MLCMRCRAFRAWPVSNLSGADRIITKKQHPCGSSTFAVLRVGMDFRIRCTKCGREVMLPRVKIEKSIKKVVREAAPL